MTTKTLAKSAYRYYKNRWDLEEGKSGNDLQHSAFSINKIINDEELDDNDIYSLVTAFFQSGKTFIAISLINMYLTCGNTPVVIVPKTVDIRQIRSRLLESFKEFKKAMIIQGFKNSELTMYDEVIYVSSTSIEQIGSLRIAVSSKNKGKCILALKNRVQIRRIYDLIEPESNIILFIDEAHTNGGYKKYSDNCDELHDNKVVYDNVLFQLKQLAKKIILISATSANILAIEKYLYSDNIYYQSHGKNYRGPMNIQYMIISTKIPPEDHYYNLIDDLSDTKIPTRISSRFKTEEKHPIILLAHVRRKCEDQHNITFETNKNGCDVLEGWLRITYQSEGIRIQHNSFTDNTVIAGVNPLSKARVYGKESNIIEGEYLYKNIQPSDVLQYLSENGGVKKFPRILITAHDMADEGVSFSSYKSPGWHLTHLLLIGNHSSARSAQIAHRLCGNHGDNLVLTCICSSTTKHKIIKEFLLHDEWVQKLCSLKQSGNHNVSEYLKNRETYSNRIPNRFITLKNKPKEYINKIINPNKKNETLIYNQLDAMCISSGINPTKYGKIPNGGVKITNISFDSKNGMERVKQIWDQKSGQVLHKLIQAYIDCSFASIKVEYLVYLGVKVSNFTSWDTLHNKYNIISKVKGGKYILNSDVLKCLKLC